MKFKVLIILLFVTVTTIAQEEKILKTFTKKELLSDYDLAISSLKEAHAGIYWYNSIAQLDSIFANERGKIKEGMNSYEFFRIMSKIVAITKEGHCRIGSSRDVGEYFNKKSMMIPVIVKMLNGKLFVLNNIENNKTKGLVITKINNEPVKKIINTIFSYSSKFADGFIETGKIRYSIDYSKFTYNYTDYFKNNSTYELELYNPKNDKTKTIKVNAVSYQEFRDIESQIEYPEFKNPIELHIDYKKSIAQLFIHSFRHTYYDENGDETIAFDVFSSKIDSVFKAIQKSNVKNLIIDVRNNGGGTEGYEDYVFSYLTNKSYSKYEYVQTNAFSFSFLNYTQHNTFKKQEIFENDMKKEFSLENDGRYLRKKDFMKVESPKTNPFKGNTYVLISGKTYSGGSEFAGLLKDKTNAVFIGEETGGGFYGQTSGFGLVLTLPNTKTKIKIPLLKFVTNFESEDIPFGRGIIPSYKIQPTFHDFINKIDTEMEFTLDLIKNKK